MTKELIYSTTNKCLNGIKSAGMDQMLKIRLECHFIRLKRYILSSPLVVTLDDLSVIETLSRELIQADEKDGPVARLEEKIKEITSRGSHG